MIQNQWELCLPKTSGSSGVPINHHVWSPSYNSCKSLPVVCDTSVTVQWDYKKYERAHADPFLKNLSKAGSCVSYLVSKEMRFMWLHMPDSSLHCSPPTFQLMGRLQPTLAKDYSTGDGCWQPRFCECYGKKRSRRDYTIFPHDREGWRQAEPLSGIAEVTQECAEWHKDGRSFHQPNPSTKPSSSLHPRGLATITNNSTKHRPEKAEHRPLMRHWTTNGEIHSHHLQLTSPVFIFLWIVPREWCKATSLLAGRRLSKNALHPLLTEIVCST